MAVYCRVSTAHLEQMNSLENQIDYFKSLVQQNLQWTLVDIYSDVQSGKNNGRAEFQRMIQDCMDNKIVCPPSKNRHKIALKNGMNLNNSFVFAKTSAFIPRFT